MRRTLVLHLRHNYVDNNNNNNIESNVELGHVSHWCEMHTDEANISRYLFYILLASGDNVRTRCAHWARTFQIPV